MKKTPITTTTYEHRGFLVDIVTTGETYEAWLSREEYGVKSLMFGVPKEQQSLDEFLEIVEANLYEYEEGYDREYAD